MRALHLPRLVLPCLLTACAAAQAPAPRCPEPPRAQAQATASSQADAASASPIQYPAADIAFKPAPPSMPAGVEMAVLEGDPRGPALFTLRLKVPPGFSLPPHTHPTPERVTVIGGSVSVGFGAEVQRESARSFGVGSFYVNPPGMVHYVFSDEGAVLQISAMGPWRVDPVSAR